MQVRVVEFNATTSFHEQLQIIAGTGIFISVHTSNLANAQFLPPGAAVFEIIQRNWCWEDLDKSFQVYTPSMMCAGWVKDVELVLQLAVRVMTPSMNMHSVWGVCACVHPCLSVCLPVWLRACMWPYLCVCWLHWEAC